MIYIPAIRTPRDLSNWTTPKLEVEKVKREDKKLEVELGVKATKVLTRILALAALIDTADRINWLEYRRYLGSEDHIPAPASSLL